LEAGPTKSAQKGRPKNQRGSLIKASHSIERPGETTDFGAQFEHPKYPDLKEPQQTCRGTKPDSGGEGLLKINGKLTGEKKQGQGPGEGGEKKRVKEDGNKTPRQH